MKSKISVFTFAFLMSAVVTFADTPSSLAVVPVTSQGIYKVYYKSAEASRVRVSIYGERNELVFTEVLSNVTAFVRPYNFSELAEGQYTIVLEDKNGQQVEKVNYVVNRVNSVIRVTEVANSSNKYCLNVVNDGAENVSVKIYDANQLLHEEVIAVKGQYGIIYNLNKVVRTPGNNLTFEVVTSSGAVKSVTF
jgi:hypothetical protein